MDIKLTSVQRDRVIRLRYILNTYRGAVLEGEPGVGKTYLACDIAKDYNQILYVGKAFALDDVKKKVGEYIQSTGVELNITFVSYNGFAKGAHAGKKYDFYIWDESHTLARYNASWTKRYVKISTGKHLHLTGTPMKKSPMDYLYVLRKCGLFESTQWFKERYFGAVQSQMYDGLELGAFRNEQCFENNVQKVSTRLLHEDLDKDSPEVNFNIIKLDVEGKNIDDITTSTETALYNERLKAKHAKPHIRRIIRENNIKRAFVLTKFHETCKTVASEFKEKACLAKKDLLKRIDEVSKDGGMVVATLGRCSSSFDFNACDHIFMVGTTYTYAEDIQAVYRCKRFGKDREINVYYIALENDHALGLTFQRQWLAKSSNRSKLSPSQLSRLEKCPGSYWLPLVDVTSERVRGAAQQGTINHEVVERYLNNPKQRIDASVPEETRGMIKYCRELIKTSEKHGIESKVNLFTWHKEFCGTVDFWAYNQGVLFVVDYKNGVGSVSAKNNLQLMAYSLMIINTYNLSPERVNHVIYQREDKKVAQYTKRDILIWEKRIKRILQAIEDAEGNPIEFINPDHSCDFFCPARSYHIKAKEEEMVKKKSNVKKTSKGKFEIKYPRATFNATVVGVSEKEDKTGAPTIGVKLQIPEIPSALKKVFDAGSKGLALLQAHIGAKNEQYNSFQFWANNRTAFANMESVPNFLDEVIVTLSFRVPEEGASYQKLGVNLVSLEVLGGSEEEEEVTEVNEVTESTAAPVVGW